MNPAGDLASPGLRIGAFVLDGLSRFVAAGTAIVVARSAGAALGILLILGYLCGELLLLATGRSPGKALLRLYVVDASGVAPGFLAMVIREWLSSRQNWYDRLLGTFVVQKPQDS